MATPRIKSVGRVGVGVTPMTGDFKAELLQYLKKVEAEISLNIDINVDKTRLKAELDAFQQRYEMKIGAVLDESSLAGDVRDKIRVAQAYADRNKIKVNTDIVDENWRKRMLDKTFKDAKEIDLALGVTVKANDIRRQLQVIANEQREHLSLPIPVTLKGEAAFKAKAEALQKSMDDKRVELRVDSDTIASDRRQFDKAVRDVNKAFEDAQARAPKDKTIANTIAARDLERQKSVVLDAYEKSLRNRDVSKLVGHQKSVDNFIEELNSKHAELQVEVSVADKAWFEQIDKELQDRTITLTPHLQTEAARAKLNVLHAEIKGKLDEHIRLGVTTEEARREMRKLLDDYNGRNIGVTVNANVLAASARLREYMERPRTLTIFVDADTKKATAKIGKLIADMTGISAVNSALGKFSGLLTNLGTIGPRVGVTSSVIGGIGAAAISSISGLASLIRSMEKLLGVAGLIPAAIAGIGAIGGTLLASFHGIGKAIAAINDNNIGGGGIRKNALAQATQEASAQRAIEIAYRNAANAAEDAEQRILDTQTAVKNARQEAVQSQMRDYRSVRDALKAYDKAATKSSEVENQVTKAREKAVQTVIDLQRAVANATIDRKQAEIAYKKALQAYMSGSTDTSESTDAVYELEVALEAARQKLSDTQADEKKLKNERNAATKAGQDGSDEVIAAKEAQSQATDDLIAAEENLAYARSEQSVNVTKNQGAIENAVRDAARAERDAVDARLNGIESITKAEEAAYNLSVQRTDTQSRMEDALKNLTAEGQKAAYAFLSVRDKMGAVRDIAQDNFFKGFTDPMVNMVDRLLPQLKAGVGAIAKTLGEGFGTFFNASTEKLKNGDLDTILQNFSKALQGMNRAIEPLVSAFTDLTVVGSEVLIPLSDGFAKWAEEFKNFIAVARADGSLKTWMEDGIKGVKELANVFKGAYRIVIAIDKAAAKVGSLTMLSLGDNLNKAADKMMGDKFQETMVYVMQGAKLALDGLGEGIKSLGKVFEDNGPAIQNLMGTLGVNLGKILTVVAKVFGDPKFIAGFQKFLDSFGSGLDKLSDNGSLFADVFGNIAEVAGKIFEFVVPIIIEMAKQVAPFMQMLKDKLPPILDAMKPMAPIISAVVLSLATFGGLGAVAGTVLTLATNLGKLFGLFGVGGAAATVGGGGGMFAGLGGAAAALAPLLPLIAAIAAAIALVVVAFTNWDVVMSNFAAAGMFFDDLGKKWQSNFDAAGFAIGNFVNGIGQFFAQADGNIKQWREGYVANLKQGWDDSIRDFGGMMRDFGGMFVDFGGMFVDFWNSAGEAGNEWWRQTSSWFNDVKGGFDGFINDIGQWISRLPEMLANAGKTIVESLGQGIRQNAPALADAANFLFGKLADFIPHSPPKKGPLSGRGYTTFGGKALVVDMARSMIAATPYMERAAASVMTAANLATAATPFDYTLNDRYRQGDAGVGGSSVAITNNVYEAISAEATAIEINRKQLAGVP